MEKQKLISQIRAKILQEKPTVDRQYLADERRVTLDIAAALNTIFFQIFKKEPSNLDRYTKEYLNVPVLQNPDTLMYYSILPAKTIQFPRVTDGLWEVSDMQDIGVNFIPTKQHERMFFSSTDAGKISSVINYVLNGNIVRYYGNTTPPAVVRMSLAVDFTEWGDTEDVPLPAGQDQNIINMIVSEFKFVPSHRISNQNETA
jgi:hypothetical protein